MYNRAQSVDFYFAEITAERMSLSDIRKEMERQRLDAAEIKVVVRLVDDMVVRAAEKAADRSIGRGMVFGGLVLAGIAGIISFLTYTGAIEIAGGTRYLVMHGPIGVGLSTVGVGWAKMNR